MKVCFLIGFLLMMSTAWGQQKNSSSANGHVFVPGTRVSMIPPQGFIASTNFAGFQEESSGSSIMIISMPASFEVISGEMNKGGLAKQGITVETTEEMQVSGLPALFISGSQKAYGLDYTKFTLIFGNDHETIVINAASPVEKKSAAKSIRKAILTTIYEPEIEIDPLAHADFTIDCSGGPLVFAAGVANSLIYTVDGELPPQTKDKTTLIAAKSFSELSIDHRKEFALQRLRALPMKIEKVIATDPTVIDGLEGYRILSEGTEEETGLRQKILLTILFGDSFYYLMVGTTHAPFEYNLALIEKAIVSFKRKQD